ncbi:MULTISPECIES: hypothetical protein [Pseudomonas]|uniref:Lipoprotein n=1 Tax=Pseudomonas sessilinigenes TaxID=658629 RepID=A0ABX8MRF8_9PSED|nr:MULTISPECIES: hypothetical protein [Pseudomonas]AZC25229.1 lipoprotein, putative [Pseudomonas sessilinigenes]QIH05210.1 hypothetical protein ATY02_00355 [Pseudomonas sp. BIOMIG1BAC]QXH40706.1 hypothetical protein KSS89_00355 [Pseudomonas sessilinigenes]
MRYLKLAGLGLLAAATLSAQADESAPGQGCYGYLTEMVRSSDFPYRDFTTPDKLKLLIDRDDGQQLSLQLFYETSGSGIIGWVHYDVVQQALWNVTIDPEEPQALKFDHRFAKAYAACLEAR